MTSERVYPPIPRDAPGGYYLTGVLWTQYFTADGASIHYNYWSSNWGYPGSHGCLGIAYNEAKFAWDWADVGTPRSTSLRSSLPSAPEATRQDRDCADGVQQVVEIERFGRGCCRFRSPHSSTAFSAATKAIIGACGRWARAILSDKFPAVHGRHAQVEQDQAGLRLLPPALSAALPFGASKTSYPSSGRHMRTI